MTELCDLHTHSTFSDGTFSPEELVDEAARCGVRWLALTDHDTLGGISAAQARGRSCGVDVIAGIEISVTEDDGQRQMHILGLGVDTENRILLEEIERMEIERQQRAASMVEQLQAVGVEVEFSAVQAISGGGAVGRPHVAQALVDAGVCRSRDDAFARYLRRGKPAYVARPEFLASA